MSVGTPEILVCLLIALLVLGPDKLPTAARQLGKALSELKRMTSDVQGQVQTFINTDPEDEAKANRSAGSAATPAVDLEKPQSPGGPQEAEHPGTQDFRPIDNKPPAIPAEVYPTITPAARSELAKHFAPVQPPTPAPAPAETEANKRPAEANKSDSSEDLDQPLSPWRHYRKDDDRG